MKSFKYKGTPEQMAKVADWLSSEGYPDNNPDCDMDVVDGLYFYEAEGVWQYLRSSYEYHELPALPPDLELEIFGSTQNITGNPENKPAESYFVGPKTEKTLEDAYDSKHTGGSIVWDGVGNMIISGGVMSDAVVPERRSEPRNKYTREIKPGVFCDVYDVLRAFEVTDGALQHLIKKALCPGKRLHKDELTDLKDIVASSQRALDIYLEWNT